MSDIEVQEHEEALRQQQMEERMKASGVPTEDRSQQSYFGFEETHKCYLPDGKSYIEHRALNEGARKKYMNEVNREVAIKRSSGDAVMKMASGDEKHSLIKQAIVDWNLVDKDGTPVPCNKGTINKFLDEANPKIIDVIDKDIRKHNPWLLQDMTVEDMEKQIEEIEEMIRVKKEDEAGKSN